MTDAEHYDAGATLAAIGRLAALLAEAAYARPGADNRRDWTGDTQAENGNYLCRCNVCGETFSGHKRRVVCRLCAHRPGAAGARPEEPARPVCGYQWLDHRCALPAGHPGDHRCGHLIDTSEGMSECAETPPPAPRPEAAPDTGEQWERCDYQTAQQHRRRVLTGSIGLEGPWSSWTAGRPDKADMGWQYDYRRRVRTCATCRYRGHQRSEWPCVDCCEYDRWEPDTEGGAA